MGSTVFTPDEDLKFYLFAHGMKVSPEADAAWREQFEGPLSLSEYASTSGVCFHTDSDVWVNAPFIEPFTEASAACLRTDSERFFVDYAGRATPVTVIPVPKYHEKYYVDPENGRRYAYTNVGVTHTDRCRISPIEGCAWKCMFCDLPFEFRYRKKPMAELLRVVELAVDDDPAAHHVLISGGTPEPEDEAWIDDAYENVTRGSPIPVDIMMPARLDLQYPKWLKSIGVNMVSINLEISDPIRARRITPHKMRLLGREHYLDYIAAAVDAFGVGFVQSLMVFGEAVESTQSTLVGVRDLAERGCLPVLSPFRPDPTTPMGRRGDLPPSIDEMKRVWDETLEICASTGGGIKPGPRCIPCHHNTVTFPDGTAFYVPLGGDLTPAGC
jgi:hypothetical protein